MRNAERDAAIVGMIQDGMTLNEVAGKVNVSRQRVQQILKEQTGKGADEVRGCRVRHVLRGPSPETESAARLYMNGWSVGAVAIIQEVSRHTAYARIKRVYPDFRSPKKRSGVVEETLARWNDGQTVKEIAAEMGAKRSTVYHRLSRNGIRTIDRYKERGRQP